ncbi:putative F-box/FBD/LRR-repeat protein At1g78840 [Impatiens glandulifera]|uniref:putative F-box/FBD/LRR-repeat protein At1g78840 n=1 Tax=Impatiens glandulifera TaxID=253017 RepID=UPI001FB0F128|nr:putative F-box/FBD/LRR-repeat protein At1g78840 [Impatiens glandulifera]
MSPFSYHTQKILSPKSKTPRSFIFLDDPLSALPDHVLSKIIRKLDLKEAVRTSILSKRWRYIWTHYRVLEFNHVNILGLKSRLARNEWVGLDTDFVNWVDKIMEQRFEGDIRKGRSSSPKFGSLISIRLESVNISNLQLARVLESCPLLEELSLDRCSNLTKVRIGDSENNNCTRLKHLSLINCLKLREIDVIRAQNLTYLDLEDVMINSLQLEMFIKCCPLLEELSLNSCPQLKYMRILESNNSPLKYLYMMNCWELVELELYANLLHTLECYLMTDWFSVMKTPKLVNVFIGELIDFHHPITRIIHDIPYHSLNFFFANDDPVPALCHGPLVFLTQEA